MTEDNKDLHSVKNLRGVGPKISESLASLGILSVQDAMFHLPFRYEDRTVLTPIGEASYDKPVLIEGEIVKSTVVFRGRRMLFTEIYDGTGRLTMRMFNFAMAQHKALKEGLMVRCYGPVTHGPNGKQMIHPQYQIFDKSEDIEIDDSLTPVYPTTSGLQQGRIRKIIRDSIAYCDRHDLLKESSSLNVKSEFVDLWENLKFIHNPPSNIDIQTLLEGKHPAQRALIKEELVAHMLCAGLLKNELEGRKGPSMDKTSDAEEKFTSSLEFVLTGAQKRTWEEIRSDLKGNRPMRRLLQGALHAYENGWQTAFMCPTEILAEQHHLSLSEWFSSLGLSVELLTGSTKSSERKEIITKLKSGEINILVGTHALFQKDVVFNCLGLTVIDEQHRFGVHQRFSMLEKGGTDNQSPHQLIMTATPIPRTLAMTVYGSLETSIIDEMPPGRKPVETSARPNSLREKVIKRIEEVCLSGQRVYWVCTLIEESEELEAQSAEELFKEISESLPKIDVGLVHGKLKKKSKDQVIKKFREGKIQLLVCTTERIKTMQETNDGFEIAEKDLELRGAGDIYGVRQSGLMDLKIANPIRDSDLLEEAQEEAIKIAKNDDNFAKTIVTRWIGNRVDYSES